MVGKHVLVPLILAAIPGTLAATQAQQFIDQLPIGVIEALVASEEAKLVASDAGPDDEFGTTVAVSADTAVVGAPGDDHAGGVDAGSAYVFVRNGANWTEQQKLTASDAAPGDVFGSVALSGDTIAVGALGDDTQGGGSAGSVYVFVRSGTIWVEQQHLTASDGDLGDRFGSSVAISGNTLVVGASYDDHGAGFSAEGSAYVFVRQGTVWSEQQKLTASDPGVQDHFGQSVTVWGNTAVIGSPRDSFAGKFNQGSAYVFVRSGTVWAQQWKLTASDGETGDTFGTSVATSGGTVVAGAPSDDYAGLDRPGSAYVFVRNDSSWSEQQKLTPSDASDDHVFGKSVALSGDTVLVGASSDDHGGTQGFGAGSAYAFARSGTAWTEQAKIIASDPEGGAHFGIDVAISAETAAIGANDDDEPSGPIDAGAAYIVMLSPEPGDLLHRRHVGQRLPGAALRQRHCERHGTERLHALGRDSRGPEGRPLLLRHERPASQPVGQRHELPVRRTARRAHADHGRRRHHRPVRRLVRAGPQRALVPHVPQACQEPRRRGRGPSPALVPRPARAPATRPRACRTRWSLWWRRDVGLGPVAARMAGQDRPQAVQDVAG